MYVNERDQINYHGFLRALREMNQVSQAAVGKGICTVSGMNRFENGNRIAEKLMRDRLTARLGISGEKYEDYLQPKEYVRWEHRLRIVKAIEKKDFALARQELDAYRELPRLNGINLQFVEAMHFMVLSAENAPKDVQLTCITNAVKYTIPNVTKALNGEHLLSDQEINLIAEYMRLCPAKKTVKDEAAWRISEYEKLIAYMDASCWEKLQKAKVYPKVVYYICQLMQEDGMTEERCRRGLELCHQAIELLRDTCRLYYFIELTEIRKLFAEFLLEGGEACVEKAELEAMLQQNASWENVFKELYAEYKVEAYMSDFCYMYYETECHDMVEVIETRRNMLGLSRVKLGEGICTDKTIIRFEREGRNPNIDLVRLLFERMGLCAEYRRAKVITNDVETLMLALEVVRNINNRDVEVCEKNIAELEHRLHMGIPYNKQEIMRWKNLLLLLEQKIDNKEFCARGKEVLECSVPSKCISKDGRKFFTREELICLFNVAFESDGKFAKHSRKIIEDICFKGIEKEISPANLFKMETYVGGLESYLGNIGRYEESIKIAKRMIEAFLKNRRMNALSNNLYSNSWNYQQLFGSEIAKVQTKKSLEKCIILSELVHKNRWTNFYIQKLYELERVN